MKCYLGKNLIRDSALEFLLEADYVGTLSLAGDKIPDSEGKQMLSKNYLQKHSEPLVQVKFYVSVRNNVYQSSSQTSAKNFCKQVFSNYI